MTTTRPPRPIEICIMAPPLSLVGGQARQAEYLIRGLAGEPSVRLSFLPHTPSFPGPLRWLQRIKYLRTVVNTLVYWFMLAIRASRYDILHAYSASYYSYLLCAAPVILLGRLLRRKVLLNYHSGEAEDHLTRWPRTAAPVMRRADLIVVPSRYLVDVFAKFGLSARPISNVVDVDRYRYRERKRIRPAFLTSRLHEPLYNVPCVLRAFALIQRKHPDASLIVAGDGPMRPSLERLATELGLRNTEFVGRVSAQAMPDLYETCDAYLNGADIDNMPGSLIECLSCGVPVVTTDAGGVPYIVTNEHTALIVPRNDPASMAAAALRLVDDPALALRLVRNGRASCRQYTWDVVRNDWLAAYHELANQPFTPPPPPPAAEPTAGSDLLATPTR